MQAIFLLFSVIEVSSLHSVHTSRNQSTFCYQIKSKGDNLRYCNLTTKWQPRISLGGLTAIVSILHVVSGISTLYVLFKVAPVISRNYLDVVKFPACVCCYPCYVIIPVLKLVWDGIDIMLDAYTFRQLETGKLIDPMIYRNENVLNAILVFTIFGIVKLFFNMWLILRVQNYFNLTQKEDIANIKRATILTAFFMEDSIELFLEYFWIEKYFTHDPPFYLAGRDIFIAMIVVFTIFSDLQEVRKKESSKYQRGLCAVLVLIGLTELLRVSSAIHQLTTLKLDQSCFQVSNGKLYQTPFRASCLKNVEYAILTVGLVSTLSCLYIFVIPIKLLTMKSTSGGDDLCKTNNYDSIAS